MLIPHEYDECNIVHTQEETLVVEVLKVLIVCVDEIIKIPPFLINDASMSVKPYKLRNIHSIDHAPYILDSIVLFTPGCQHHNQFT